MKKADLFKPSDAEVTAGLRRLAKAFDAYVEESVTASIRRSMANYKPRKKKAPRHE